METAADLLKAQAYQSIYRIAPAASVFDALKLMAAKDVDDSNGVVLRDVVVQALG